MKPRKGKWVGSPSHMGGSLRSVQPSRQLAAKLARIRAGAATMFQDSAASRDSAPSAKDGDQCRTTDSARAKEGNHAEG